MESIQFSQEEILEIIQRSKRYEQEIKRLNGVIKELQDKANISSDDEISRKRTKKGSRKVKKQNILDNNRFGQLMDDEDIEAHENENAKDQLNSNEVVEQESPVATEQTRKVNKSNIRAKIGVNIANTAASSSENGKKKKKIIQVADASIGSVLQTIKNRKCVGFTLKQGNVSSPLKITIDNPDEIPIIRDALKAENLNFHEFKWESEKQLGFIIRGLAGVTENDIPEVLEELRKAGIPASAKLSLFRTGFMKANPNKTHNSLLKLVLPPNFDTKILQKIRYIDHVAVTFEKMKSKSVVQCLNCQRFGHTASGCQHKHRCVKCGANHLRDKCLRTFDKSIKLLCCNCGGEHSANNLSNCPYFIKNFGAKKVEPNVTSMSSSKLIKQNSLSSTAKRIPVNNKTSRVSYADVASMSSTPAFLSDLSIKMEQILQLVLKHDTIIQKLVLNA